MSLPALFRQKYSNAWRSVLNACTKTASVSLPDNHHGTVLDIRHNLPLSFQYFPDLNALYSQSDSVAFNYRIEWGLRSPQYSFQSTYEAPIRGQNNWQKLHLNLTWTVLGLCRNISAGKSCMMTSRSSSQVVLTKLWLSLLRELKIEQATGHFGNKIYILDSKSGKITPSRGYKYLSFDDNICRSVVFKVIHGNTENFKHLTEVLTAG